MRKEYIEEAMKKHKMQYLDLNKDNMLNDLAKKINNVKLFTNSMKRRHAFKKKPINVQFEESPIDDTNISMRKSLMPAEQANIFSNISAMSLINPIANATVNNNITQNLINKTEHTEISIKEDYTKIPVKRKLANILCGDVVYHDTQKIKLLDGKFFSAYIFMDENPINQRKSDKRIGKSIRSVINSDEEENTIFVEKYSLINKSIFNKSINYNNNNSNNYNSQKSKSSLSSSKILPKNFKPKKIHSQSNSRIPINLLGSSSKSNLSQSSKLNLLHLKGRNSTVSDRFIGETKKLTSTTSLNFQNVINNNNKNNLNNLNNTNNVNKTRINLQSNSKVKYAENILLQETNNYSNRDRSEQLSKSSYILKKTNSKNSINHNHLSNNNKEIEFVNGSFNDKSALQENENKTNNSVFLKTILQKKSMQRSSTPILVRDEIFNADNLNDQSKELKISKAIIKMNNNFGINFRTKLRSENLNYFKKEDFYYNKKFHF